MGAKVVYYDDEGRRKLWTGFRARACYIEAMRQPHVVPDDVQEHRIMPMPHNGGNHIAEVLYWDVLVRVKVLYLSDAIQPFRRDYDADDMVIVIVSPGDSYADIQRSLYYQLELLSEQRRGGP